MDVTLTQILQELIAYGQELDRLRPELENLRRRVRELEDSPQNGTALPAATETKKPLVSPAKA